MRSKLTEIAIVAVGVLAGIGMIDVGRLVARADVNWWLTIAGNATVAAGVIVIGFIGFALGVISEEKKEKQ